MDKKLEQTIKKHLLFVWEKTDPTPRKLVAMYKEKHIEGKYESGNIKPVTYQRCMQCSNAFTVKSKAIKPVHRVKPDIEKDSLEQFIEKLFTPDYAQYVLLCDACAKDDK